MLETLTSPLSKVDLEAELTSVNRRIERADENENPIERTATLDNLLEQRDWIVATIGELSRMDEE